MFDKKLRQWIATRVANRIPFETDAFDIATCIDVIEHVPDCMGLILEMVQDLRRLFLLCTPNVIWPARCT